MRIVIDMQGVQTESRFRGIGRYTLSFTQAIVRNRGEHEVILALSGLFPDTIEPIREAFEGLLPQENIRVWFAPGPVLEGEPGNEKRREVAELIREAFLASLQPDVIHITSLFEGYVDNAVTSIGRFDTKTPVTVSLYDLIPLLNPEQYLTPNPQYAQYYQRKIDYLKQVSGMLAISEFSRKEGIATLNLPESSFINISTAIEPFFKPQEIDHTTAKQLKDELNISKPYILYTGGADERKNLPRLIEAYSMLPQEIRQEYQLVFAGKMPQGDVERFKHIANGLKLKKDELIFTGYITDQQLVQLYNLCRLYVFPSWHEGFGLPALEAMACGALVIGANTTSLPEVIGLEEALFDPLDVNAMSKKMLSFLVDQEKRERLKSHAKQQLKNFSWDKTAKCAIVSWEQFNAGQKKFIFDEQIYPHQQLLINQIAQHIAADESVNLLEISKYLAHNEGAGKQRQLLLDVSELCQNDAATGVQRVVRSYLHQLLLEPPENFTVQLVYATQTEGYRYASKYLAQLKCKDPEYFDDLPMRWKRGDIFFGLDMQHDVQLAHSAIYSQLRQNGVTVKFLVHDLLPIQLEDFFMDSKLKVLHERWLAMVAMQDEAVCVSKATADAYCYWLKDNKIPTNQRFHISCVHNGADIEGSKPSSGIPSDASEVLSALTIRPTFLSVSTIEPRKAQEQILDAVEKLWVKGVDINLVFVGQQGWKVDALVKRITLHPENSKRLFWLKGISDEYLTQVYQNSTCLIAASLNEGFGLPLIEAAMHKLSVIARDIPVFREIAGNAAFYFTANTGAELAEAITQWLQLYKNKSQPDSSLMKWNTWQQSSKLLKVALIKTNYNPKQFLVDISELVNRDSRTGIQRVVRNVFKEWLLNPPTGYTVEPVYATSEKQGYFYARKFTAQFLDIPSDLRDDEPIDAWQGDIFVALDLQPHVLQTQSNFLTSLSNRGVIVKTVAYDLLPVLLPHVFVEGAQPMHQAWLKTTAKFDGVVCISKAVADEYQAWLLEQDIKTKKSFSIDWFHLGADIDASHSTKGLPANAKQLIDTLERIPSFLMVGTLEPRKGHAQTLQAFEQLWAKGLDVNLVMVGKQGWMVENFITKINTHPELDKRLFWLDGISDEFLEQVYSASTCLIAASEGEGFGLPLIEAAQKKLPIIARDLPVFKEVAGEYAYYFENSLNPDVIATTIQDWLELYKTNKHPKSNGLPWLTWKQSAQMLIKKILIND